MFTKLKFEVKLQNLNMGQGQNIVSYRPPYPIALVSPCHEPTPTADQQLHVVVRRARNLTSHDMNGKNDPYVKLRLGTQRAVTRVQLRTNSPEWNELFLFGVSSVEAQQLHMTVRDYDKYKHDDLIGSCNVGLSHLPCEVAADSERKEGGPAGMSVYPGKLSAYSAHGARRGGDGGSGSGYESRLECSVGGSGHVPIGRHDKRTSLLAHESYHVLGDNEYDDDNGLRPSGSQGSFLCCTGFCACTFRNEQLRDNFARIPFSTPLVDAGCVFTGSVHG